jgi:hypothetical protein
MSIYQWLCLLGVQGIITLVLSWVISKKLNTADAKAEQAKRETAAIAEGVKALLRDRLLQGYKHYIEKGYADMDDRSNMENVWRQYHALGGNGDMNDLRRTFRHLPMAKDGTPMIINQEGDESV